MKGNLLQLLSRLLSLATLVPETVLARQNQDDPKDKPPKLNEQA